MKNLKLNKGVFPKRRKNPVAWYMKNKIGYKEVSMDFGVSRFIDRLHLTDKI